MDSLPIDIHSTKLLSKLLDIYGFRYFPVNFLYMNCLYLFYKLFLSDWLVSRRHCKADVDFTEIRRKIGEAIKDMPENDRILQLLAGSCNFINFHISNL